MPHLPYSISPDDAQYTAVRSQGAGGQNVNKVSSAVQLRYNITTSTLSPELKTRLLAYKDQRITAEGEIVIKAQEHRTQEQNKTDAFERLLELVALAAFTPKKRKPTKATRASKERRLQGKSKRSELKKLRKV